jgi:hypothetical protein
MSSKQKIKKFWLTAGDSCLSIQEAEIRRTDVWGQPQQIACKTWSQKNPSHKKADGMIQGVGPEFKPQSCKEKHEAK